MKSHTFQQEPRHPLRAEDDHLCRHHDERSNEVCIAEEKNWIHVVRETPRQITGTQFIEALLAAGVITVTDAVRRIVIDAQVGHTVAMYVERFGDERLIDIAPTITGFDVKLQDRVPPAFEGPFSTPYTGDPLTSGIAEAMNRKDRTEPDPVFETSHGWFFRAESKDVGPFASRAEADEALAKYLVSLDFSETRRPE